MKENKKPQKSYFKIYKELMGPRFKICKWLIILILFYSAISLINSLVFAKYGIDYALQSGKWSKIVITAVAIFLCYLLSDLSFHLAWNISIKNKKIICVDLRQKVFHKMINFDTDYYSNHASGAMLHTVVSDIETFADGGVWNLIWMSYSIINIIASLFLATFINFKLSLILWAVIPFVSVGSYYLIKQTNKLYDKRREINKYRLGHINEGIMGYTTIKNLNLDDRNVKEFRGHSTKYAHLDFSVGLLHQSFWRFFDLAVFICLAIFYYLSYKQYINLQISLGELYLYFILFTKCLYSIADLAGELDYFGEVMVAARKIDGALHHTCLVENKENTINGPEKLKGNIHLNNVTFKYPKGETILSDFSLNIKEKEKIAIVGRTGSGKSTIASLIYRLYEPNKGQLLLDGQDYTDYSLSYIHSQIGFILQEPLMFDDSILNNIKYGKLDASLEEVIEVAKLVGIHEYIDSLPNKYESNMGEGGVSLSLGQKQMISFARVLLKNPSIVILDEATANVDTETEKIMQDSINKFFKDKTCIFIAHRLSTIRDADRILYLEKGKVLEEGNHDNLMNKKGKYYSLYQSQFINKELESI